MNLLQRDTIHLGTFFLVPTMFALSVAYYTNQDDFE